MPDVDTRYQDYLKLTGNAQSAALLVHSEVLASFDETILSIYEDAKRSVPRTMLKSLLEKFGG